MKITTVTFSKKYPYAPYLNFDIGFEAEIGADENPLGALKELEEMSDRYHKNNYPQLEETYVSSQLEQESLPFTPKTQPHSTIEAINTCTNLKELQDFQLLVKNMSNKYPEIKTAYDNKLKQLQL